MSEDYSPAFMGEDQSNEEESFDGGNIFAGVNWAEGTDNPFGLEPGAYEVTISETEVTRSEKGNLGLWVQFSTDAEKEEAGVSKSIRKWVSLPEKSQTAQIRSRNTSFLRLLMRNLEIPEENWDTLDPADLVGIDCVIIVRPQKNNPDYMQVSKISRDHSRGVVSTESSTVYGDPVNLDIPTGSSAW